MLARHILVADECWIALASLLREQPDRPSFFPTEVFERLRAEHAYPEVRAGVQAHIYLHNVANLPPNSAQYRMFYRLPDGSLRLFRPADDAHFSRKGKTSPKRSELPAPYHHLLDWYEQDYSRTSADLAEQDPVLRLRGLGKEIWSGVGADAYVANLRAGWAQED